ncbi:hypothetical protein HN011_003558 [Eciton burchellii]|nr:hypothetical protein HN011_003558 [Eciton burchellii]
MGVLSGMSDEPENLVGFSDCQTTGTISSESGSKSQTLKGEARKEEEEDEEDEEEEVSRTSSSKFECRGELRDSPPRSIPTRIKKKIDDDRPERTVLFARTRRIASMSPPLPSRFFHRKRRRRSRGRKETRGRKRDGPTDGGLLLNPLQIYFIASSTSQFSYFASGWDRSVDSEEDEEIEMEVEPRCKIRLVHEASGLLCRVERLLTANPDDEVETEVETSVQRIALFPEIDFRSKRLINIIIITQDSTSFLIISFQIARQSRAQRAARAFGFSDEVVLP